MVNCDYAIDNNCEVEIYIEQTIAETKIVEFVPLFN